jgi:hypothetical protein
MKLGLSIALAAAVWVLTSPAPFAQAPQENAPKLLRYVRAGPNGAKARNLQDPQGLVVLELAPASLVAVYQDHGEWLEAEVPGGFEVWVFGQYVKASSEAGVLEITGNGVQQRPIPSSGNESYPLTPSLVRGERVRLITRHDASKPLAEDWVKVYSPPGVRAFVAKSETEPLPQGTDGAALWAQAAMDAKKKLPAATGAIGAGTAVTAGASTTGSQSAIDLLHQADQMLARERTQAKPDYEAVRAAYTDVLKVTKDGATADLARRGLAEVDARIEALRIQNELEQERLRRDTELARRQDALNKANQTQDVYAGRFDSRGWIEKRAVPGAAPTYVVRWGGDQVAALVCNSGRYDLAVFAGYEVGVNGRELKAALSGDSTHPSQPRLLDVARIEVLAGRYQGR